MNADSTDRLVRELSRDIAPVRRQAPFWLRVAALAAGLLAAGVGLLAWIGPREDWLARIASLGPESGLVIGLVVAGVAGAAASLAGGTPDREGVARIAGIVAIVGLAGSAGSALAAWSSVGFTWGDTSFAMDRMCFQRVFLLSLPPGAAVALWMARGWVGRPRRAAVAALVVAVAFGSVLVELTCTLGGERHMVLGHVSPVWILLGAGALPLALWLRRFGR